MPAIDVVLQSLAQSELAAAIQLRAAMNRELNGADPDVRYPGWRERFKDFFSARIAQGTAAIYVARSSGTPLGLSSVYRLTTHRTEIFLQPVAYITSVYVVPDQRRQGLATSLTQACIDWARAHGCDVIRLRSSSIGRPVYLQMGFTPSDELELRYDRPR